jgi:hypothetical protein
VAERNEYINTGLASKNSLATLDLLANVVGANMRLCEYVGTNLNQYNMTTLSPANLSTLITSVLTTVSRSYGFLQPPSVLFTDIVHRNSVNTKDKDVGEALSYSLSYIGPVKLGSNFAAESSFLMFIRTIL